jgi:hypothetical protein
MRPFEIIHQTPIEITFHIDSFFDLKEINKFFQTAFCKEYMCLAIQSFLMISLESGAPFSVI